MMSSPQTSDWVSQISSVQFVCKITVSTSDMRDSSTSAYLPHGVAEPRTPFEGNEQHGCTVLNDGDVRSYKCIS